MLETDSKYFIEIEEHFRRARGTPFFRLSPMDWALIEAWQSGGIPLAAVLRGIDVAFEKWRKRPAQARIEMVNSLSYCSHAISAEAQTLMNASPSRQHPASSPLLLENIRSHIDRNMTALSQAGHEELAAALKNLSLDELFHDLEALEDRLTSLEQKLISKLRAADAGKLIDKIRAEFEREMKPYRASMTPDQIATLEDRLCDRKLLEWSGLPRLSLFYL